MNSKILKDSLILGSALFAMFFGAGNMIFPPYLGLECSSEWFGGFLGYFTADIILAMIAICAQIRTGGFERLLDPLGKLLKGFFLISIILCLGPVITIPRTAATTFELIPSAEVITKPVFYIIFFAVVILLTINKSGVVDAIGKFLTPLLLIGLLVIIAMGIINPLGEISAFPKVSSPVASGIEAGYQSMDVLAATIFGVLILSGAKDRGHTSLSECRKVTIGASVFSGLALFVIYMGLTYVGATVSQKYNMHISKSVLLTSIVRSLLGGYAGQVLFSVVASLACLSTAVALVGSCAHFIGDMLKGKLSYKVITVIICIASGFIAMLGVDSLIVFASPVLNIIYPPVLCVIILSFLKDAIGRFSYILPVLSAMLISILQLIFGHGLAFLNILPLYRIGLGWMLPSAICFAIGFCIDKKRAVKD